MQWIGLGLCLSMLLAVVASKTTNTLIIIYGHYRTFDITCPDIVKHIIEPNAPNIHIILSLDIEPPFRMPIAGGTCLDPYVSKLTIMEGVLNNYNNKHVHVKEFLLVARAFEYAASLKKHFNYAIKLRFDNGINRPILPLSYIYHPHISDKNSITASPFKMFQEELDVKFKQRKGRLPSFTERAWSWIITSGNPVFIESSFRIAEDVPVWTPYHVEDFTKRIYNFVFNQTSVVLKSQHDVIKLIHTTMTKLRPVYMIGSTWIHYGPYELVQKATRLALDDFCNKNWSMAVGNNHRFSRNPARVTEAVIRLVHWQQKLNLVDLIHWPDYAKSFNDSDMRSYTEDKHDPNRHYYLVRTCERLPLRGGCRINSQARRIAGRQVQHSNGTIPGNDSCVGEQCSYSR